jgi:hypothetical protein
LSTIIHLPEYDTVVPCRIALYPWIGFRWFFSGVEFRFILHFGRVPRLIRR